MKNHDSELTKIGLNISYYRKKCKLTQMALAEKVGISRTYISKIEAQNVPKSLSLETLLDIADALEVPAAKLLDFTR